VEILTRVGSPQFALLLDVRTLRSGPQGEAGRIRTAQLGKWIPPHATLEMALANGPEGPTVEYVLVGEARSSAVSGAGEVLAGARLPGLLLLRVGEEVAPGDRGTRRWPSQYAKVVGGYLAEAGGQAS